MTAATVDEAPPPAERPSRSLWRSPLVWLVLFLVAVAALVRFGPLTAPGRRLIEIVATGQKVGRLGRLEVAGLHGDIWGDFTLDRLAVRDASGAWLEARNLAMRWDAAALLARRLHARQVSAETVSVLRRPRLTAPTPPSPSLISIGIDRLRARLELAPAFAARRGLYDVTGALAVDRKGPVAGSLAAASLTHAGDFLKAQFDLGGHGAFRVVADGEEANGGALAGAAGLAADKPFALHARAWGGKDSGAVDVATRIGTATPLTASGAWTKAGGSASGRVELAASSLLARYAAMLGPTAEFQVAARPGTAGRLNLDGRVKTANLAAAAKGEADLGRLATGPAGLAVDLALADASRVANYPGLGPARLTGVVTGDTRRWRFAGAQSLAAVRLPDFSFARIGGTARIAMADGDLRVSGEARGEGGAGRGVIAAWLGARPSGAADIERLADGRVLLHALRIAGPGITVQARGDRALLGGLTLSGSARLTNLAQAARGASGAVAATWSASQSSAKAPWSFSFDAAAARFATGLGAEIDRLLGAAPRLVARGEWSPERLAVTGATLTGAAGSASASGLIGKTGDLALKLAWTARGPFGVGPVTIVGAASGSGAVTGTLAAPRADLTAQFASVDALGTPLRDARLTLLFNREPAGGAGRFALTALSAWGPARAAAAFGFSPGELDLHDIALAGAGVEAGGSASLRHGEPSSADLAFSIGPGALLAAGRAAGQIKIVQAAGSPHVDLALRADGVRLAGGASVESLRLTAAGPLARLPYRASAQGAFGATPWSLAGAGVASETSGGRALSFTGTGRARGVELRTLAPAQVAFGAGGLSARLQLAGGGGRAAIQFDRHGEAVSAHAVLSDLGLKLINPDLIGRFDATVDLRGSGTNLGGTLSAKLSGAGGRDLKGAAPVDGEVTARLSPGRLLVSAQAGNSHGLAARGQLSLPALASAEPFHIAIDRRRPMAGQFAINGELKPIWDLLIGGDRSLSGRVAASGTLAGTLADPRVTGTATLDGGAFHDASTGLKLRNVTLRAVLANNAVDVGAFKADDGARGALTGSGRLSLERAGASDLQLALNGFRLIDNDLAQATASGQVRVDRGADGRVKLSGALTIDQARISPNPPVATGVTPMEVVEIHRPRALDTRYAARPAAAPPVTLDVGLRAPRGIFVKGRGLDLELSLNAHVGGTTASPDLTGIARVTRGDYNFAGQRFTIDESGSVHLGSTPETIRLDLTATRDNPTLTAVVQIRGTAAKPTITLTSTPALPQDEILSQVLFGASASQLNALQAAQLASAVAGLSTGGGFDVIGGLRNLAHLDRLAIGGDATNGSTIAGGKYITDKVYLELIGGGREGSGAQVEWRVRKHVSLVSRVTSQGDSQVSIRWRKDY